MYALKLSIMLHLHRTSKNSPFLLYPLSPVVVPYRAGQEDIVFYMQSSQP